MKECVDNLDQTCVVARSPTAGQQPSSNQLAHGRKGKVPLRRKINLMKSNLDTRGKHQDMQVLAKSRGLSLSVRGKY